MPWSRVGIHGSPSAVQWATVSGVLALGRYDGEARGPSGYPPKQSFFGAFPPHPFGLVGGHEPAAVKDQCQACSPNAAILSQNAAPWAALMRNLFPILRVFAPPCETYPPPPCDGEGARPFGLPSEA